jgi:glutamate carboxypeptidase
MKRDRPGLIRVPRTATGGQLSVGLKALPTADMVSFFRSLEPQMIQWLTRLVNTDTPSDQKKPIDQLANWFAGQLRKCGAQTKIIKNREAGNHLLARWTCSGSRQKPVLILGHLDTVWGSAESKRRPARIEQGKLFGPGCRGRRGGLTLVALSQVASGARYRR